MRAWTFTATVFDVFGDQTIDTRNPPAITTWHVAASGPRGHIGWDTTEAPPAKDTRITITVEETPMIDDLTDAVCARCGTDYQLHRPISLWVDGRWCGEVVCERCVPITEEHDGGIDNDESEPCEKEPWSYEVDGRTYEAWKVWHVPPPGPVGSGVLYREIRTEDVLGPDNRWERHVYEIEVA